MVMKAMRKNFHLLKWAIWAVVIAFVLSVALPYLAPDPQALRAPATVNGAPLSSIAYNQAFKSQLSSLRDLYGDDVPQSEQKRLRKEILNTLIDEELALQGARELGLEVNDQEFRQVVQNEPSFRNRQTGTFELVQYQNFLSRQIQQGLTVDAAEANIRRGLMVAKARAIFGNSASVSPLEIQEGVSLLNRKVKARAHLWLFKNLEKEIQVNEDDIRRYFSKNKKSWRKSPQVKARHILIKIDADSTSLAAKAKADKIYQRAKAGENFATLARENSEDEASAKKGGDVGFFGKNEMVPAFEQKANSLKKGEIGEPILSQFGWHIIKVTGNKKGYEPSLDVAKDKAKAKAGLLEQRARTEARRKAGLALKKLREGVTAEEIAKTLGADLKITGWFNREDKTVLSSLGETPFFARATLLLAKNEIPSEPLFFDEGVVIALIIDQKEGPPKKDKEELEQQRQEIHLRLQADKAKALYAGWIESLRANADIIENPLNAP